MGESIQRTVVMAGSQCERSRAQDYLKLLVQHGKGLKGRVDWAGRDDCIAVEMPTTCVPLILGCNRVELTNLERETGTFCFLDRSRRYLERKSLARLLICGHSETGREKAKLILEKKLDTEGGWLYHNTYELKGDSHDERRERDCYVERRCCDQSKNSEGIILIIGI